MTSAGTVTTFYDYAGASANQRLVAAVSRTLAGRGRRVLCVDASPDMVSPAGLFESKQEQGSPGFLSILEDEGSGEERWPSTVVPSADSKLDLLPSGVKYGSPSESWSRLKSFSLKNHDNPQLGVKLAKIADAWRSQYDHIIVRASAGGGPMSRVASVQLADQMVLIVSPDPAMMKMTGPVVDELLRARSALAHKRERYRILPVIADSGFLPEAVRGEAYFRAAAECLSSAHEEWRDGTVDAENWVRTTSMEFVPDFTEAGGEEDTSANEAVAKVADAVEDRFRSHEGHPPKTTLGPDVRSSGSSNGHVSRAPAASRQTLEPDKSVQSNLQQAASLVQVGDCERAELLVTSVIRSPPPTEKDISLPSMMIYVAGLARAWGDNANAAALLAAATELLLEAHGVEGASVASAESANGAGHSPSNHEASEGPSKLPKKKDAGAEESYVAPWINQDECMSCDVCVEINPDMFKYNSKRQAYIADAEAGPYRDLVKAAERCAAQVIHPGLPRERSEKDIEKLIARAQRFN